jgi:type VI secretion system protein ImpM
MDGAIGFYGKLPALGDFVQRRLPAEFVAPWDRWLQDSMLAARESLGPSWLVRFQAAPPWRFVLAPGALTAHGWIGLLIPSCDRVGRWFPLTLAQPCAEAPDLLATLECAAPWFDALERLAQEAFEAGLGLPEFDARLALLGAAPLVPACAAEDDTMPLRGAGAAPPLAHRIGARLDRARIARALAALRQPASLLAGGDPPVLLALERLPAPALAVALLDGQWAAHGWCYEDGAEPHGADATRPFDAAPPTKGT